MIINLSHSDLDKNNYSRIDGIAIVSVLIALLVITPVVYKLANQQKESVLKAYAYKTGMVTISDAIAVEMWARQVLLQDIKDNNYDSHNEVWALPLPATLSEASTLSGKLEDLDSRINLNNITFQQNPGFIDILRRIFINQTAASSADIEIILNSLQDWLDLDSNAREYGGAEDDYYQLLEKPYRAANNIMTHISELKLLRGMTEEIYEQINPYLTVLPKLTKVNVNTATNEVLQAIFPESAHAFISSNLNRDGGVEYKSINEFSRDYEANVNEPIPNVIMNSISVSSEFFVGKIISVLDDTTMNMLSFLQRDNNSKSIRVIYRYIDN